MRLGYTDEYSCSTVYTNCPFGPTTGNLRPAGRSAGRLGLRVEQSRSGLDYDRNRIHLQRTGYSGVSRIAGSERRLPSPSKPGGKRLQPRGGWYQTSEWIIDPWPPFANVQLGIFDIVSTTSIGVCDEHFSWKKRVRWIGPTGSPVLSRKSIRSMVILESNGDASTLTDISDT